MPVNLGPVFKVIVLGESDVGKTSLLYKYTKGKPPDANEIQTTTVMDHVEKVVDCEGTAVKLSIWDSSGREKVREAVTPILYRKVNCVIFVYDVTSPDSLEMLYKWFEECKKNNLSLKEVPVLLLANKSDLHTLF